MSRYHINDQILFDFAVVKLRLARTGRIKWLAKRMKNRQIHIDPSRSSDLVRDLRNFKRTGRARP